MREEIIKGTKVLLYKLPFLATTPTRRANKESIEISHRNNLKKYRNNIIKIKVYYIKI